MPGPRTPGPTAVLRAFAPFRTTVGPGVPRAAGPSLVSRGLVFGKLETTAKPLLVNLLFFFLPGKREGRSILFSTSSSSRCAHPTSAWASCARAMTGRDPCPLQVGARQVAARGTGAGQAPRRACFAAPHAHCPPLAGHWLPPRARTNTRAHPAPLWLADGRPCLWSFAVGVLSARLVSCTSMPASDAELAC